MRFEHLWDSLGGINGKHTQTLEHICEWWELCQRSCCARSGRRGPQNSHALAFSNLHLRQHVEAECVSLGESREEKPSFPRLVGDIGG